MINTKYTVSFLALALIIGLAACKKKDKSPTSTDLLVQGKWKLTAATYGGVLDLMQGLEDCQKDNLYLFNADHSITVDEGATKCNASGAQTYTDGNWSLQKEDKELTIGGTITSGFGSLSGTLLSLDAAEFKVEKDTTISGFNGKINLTFRNQH